MKRLLLVLALTSCAHKQSIDEQATDIKIDLAEQQINGLRKDVQQLRYFIDHEKCFISYAICLGEKTYSESKTCWNKHEACVVRVYHQYKGNK